MKKYMITVNVESASGTQDWVVEAESAEDALERYNNGEGDIEYSEIEVTQLGDVSIEQVVEMKDDKCHSQ